MLFEKKGFGKPDDQVVFKDKGQIDLFSFHDGDTVVGRAVLKPGWRWSTDVKELAGGEDLCQSEHTGYCSKGTLAIRTKDGQEERFTAGELFYIAPDHDAWVEGDEPVELIDFTGMKGYFAKREKEKAA